MTGEESKQPSIERRRSANPTGAPCAQPGRQQLKCDPLETRFLRTRQSCDCGCSALSGDLNSSTQLAEALVACNPGDTADSLGHCAEPLLNLAPHKHAPMLRRKVEDETVIGILKPAKISVRCGSRTFCDFKKPLRIL